MVGDERPGSSGSHRTRWLFLLVAAIGLAGACEPRHDSGATFVNPCKTPLVVYLPANTWGHPRVSIPASSETWKRFIGDGSYPNPLTASANRQTFQVDTTGWLPAKDPAAVKVNIVHVPETVCGDLSASQQPSPA